MQFPQRDLTGQHISTSYQDVVQRYLSGSVDYMLDGLGFVIAGLPVTSIGGILLTQDQTASFATTASFAMNGGGTTQISTSWASSSFTSTSASYAVMSDVAQVADVALMADTASISVDAISSSFATTASFALNVVASGTTLVTASTYPITSSSAISASWAPTVGTGTTLITGSDYPITSSWADNATIALSSKTSTSSSYSQTASFAQFVNGGVGTTLITASTYQITSSVSLNSLTTSYITSSNIVGTIVNSTSSSYSQTASFALNVVASGTTLVTASTYPITTSFAVSASWAPVTTTGTTLTTASTYPITSSWALNSVSVSSTSASYLSGSSGSVNILNLYPHVTSSAVINVNALSNSTSSYSIGNGAWINFPVPYIRGNSNTPIAFDIMPGGGGQNAVSIDLSDTDVVANNAVNYETLHLVKNPAGNAVISSHALGTGTIRPLVFQDSSGSIGFNTSPSEQYHAKFDQNARTTLVLENANAGNTAHSTIEARTDSTNARYFRIVSTGTGFTSNGAFGQDGGALELGPSKSGSLSILTRTTASAIVMYQGGFASSNEKFRIAAPTGRVGIGGVPNPVNSLDVIGNISCSIITSSLLLGTSSYANSSSYSISASYAPSVSSSYSSTASYVLLNGNVNTLPIANVLYLSSSFANLNDFSFVGLTASIVSNAIRFPTGAGDWNQYMMLNNPIHMDGNWELEVTYTPNTVVSFGLGIGKISVSSNTFFPMQARGQLWASSSHLYIANNTTTNVVDVLDTGFNNTFPGDTITVRFKQNNNVLSFYAKNSTSGYTRTIIYKDPLLANTGSNLQFMPNTGRFTIWNPNAAGTIDIKSIKVTSYTPQLPYLSVVGDSKVIYSSGDFKLSFPQLLSSQYFTPIVPYFGPGDRTIEISQSIGYLVNNIKPKNVILLMGRNDVLSNVTASTWQPNYNYIVNTLLTASIGVTHILPIPESSSLAVNLSQSLLRTFIINTYGYDKCIDVTANFNTNSMISTDTVHPNSTGHQWIADSILGSGLLKQ